MINALHSTRQKVIITTPYFIPDKAFLEAMETAALKGIDVKLIMPLKSDQKLVGNASQAY